MVVLGVRCNGPRPAQISLGHTFPADFNFKPSFPGFQCVGTRGRCVANASSPKNTGSPQQAGTHKTTSGISRWVVITKKNKKKGNQQRISKRFPDDFLSRMFEMPQGWYNTLGEKEQQSSKIPATSLSSALLHPRQKGPTRASKWQAAFPSSFSDEVRCVTCDGRVRRYNNRGRPPRSCYALSLSPPASDTSR